jgi:hypothetical protein
MKYAPIIVLAITLIAFGILIYESPGQKQPVNFCTSTITLPHPGFTEVAKEYRDGTVTIVYYEDPSKMYPMLITTATVVVPCNYEVTWTKVTTLG